MDCHFKGRIHESVVSGILLGDRVLRVSGFLHVVPSGPDSFCFNHLSQDGDGADSLRRQGASSSSILSVRGRFFPVPCAMKIMFPGGKEQDIKDGELLGLELWQLSGGTDPRPYSLSQDPAAPQGPGRAGVGGGFETHIACFAGSNKALCL